MVKGNKRTKELTKNSEIYLESCETSVPITYVSQGAKYNSGLEKAFFRRNAEVQKNSQENLIENTISPVFQLFQQFHPYISVKVHHHPLFL